ncbi:hypothetical protein TcWFU_000396 [Taenia crassiceps]|uniref:Uncharacterized protein n=1 Tax=Taenia crassiceps TaxID=6207 RepID=A0ABR4Q7N9_9CEST
MASQRSLKILPQTELRAVECPPVKLKEEDSISACQHFFVSRLPVCSPPCRGCEDTRCPMADVEAPSHSSPSSPPPPPLLIHLVILVRSVSQPRVLPSLLHCSLRTTHCEVRDGDVIDDKRATSQLTQMAISSKSNANTNTYTNPNYNCNCNCHCKCNSQSVVTPIVRPGGETLPPHERRVVSQAVGEVVGECVIA